MFSFREIANYCYRVKLLIIWQSKNANCLLNSVRRTIRTLLKNCMSTKNNYQVKAEFTNGKSNLHFL